MKLIKKSDLSFGQGYLTIEDGTIVNPPRLAREVNELVEMQNLNDFIAVNKAKIEASNEIVTYKQKSRQAPVITSGTQVATPELDKDKAAKEARAEEFLAVKDAEKVDEHLARYQAIATWLDEDTIMMLEGGNFGDKFLMDPFAVTEAFVIEVVKTYHEQAKLRSKINIEFC